MPELPEVETIRRSLCRWVTGRQVESVRFGAPPVAMYPDPARFRRQLAGETILGLARRGKYLLFLLSGDRRLVLHLGMSGQVRRSDGGPMDKHERLRLGLSGGRTLSYLDARRFGRLCLVNGANLPRCVRGISRLGPEPLESGFTRAFLSAQLRGRKAAVKNLLLDQRVACGVGNIYADEALYRAGIRPTHAAGELSPKEVARLTAALRHVLRCGIRWCGTTTRDRGYVLPDGKTGSFQSKLRVYGREGKSCLRRGCSGVVLRLKLSGRSAHCCSVCQK